MQSAESGIAGTPPTGTRDAKRSRATLGACAGTHFLHDGFSDVIYLLLPLWQAEFALSLTQVGIVKSAYSAAMAAGQIPAGLLAERLGERRLLALGTAVTGLGFIGLGFVGGMASLVAMLAVAALGSSVQHPLSATLVSKAYEGRGQRAALGIYNFSGDVGKAAVPALAALVVTALGWRWAAGGYGAIGVAAAVLILVLLVMLDAGAAPARRLAKASLRFWRGGWGIRHARGFGYLSAIEIIDGASRPGFLTFLPFLLIAKGAEVEGIGLALALTFIGGAVGKFLCGVLAERIGIILTVVLTEALTAAGIVVLLYLPLWPAMALLPAIGVMLNGTSSVLYGSIAEFVAPESRARAFGLFYTLGIGAGAVSPWLFGALSDAASLEVALLTLAGVILTTLPLAGLLRRPLAEVGQVA
ncbi:MAG: MFS transporter [Alphaproteobacteria bacterium]|jgi:MFS family permease|nr:MFS transporter [Alphaproteobacteria bacterium]